MLDYAAFPEQRQEQIYQILLKNGRVICAELALQLDVSEHTIRRDLQELSQQGICKKVYGGAVLQLDQEEDFKERKASNRDEKHQLAKKCVRLIKPGSCVYLDVSTTNLVLAQSLPATLKATIVTNSPEIAVSLLKLNYCEVVLLGGIIYPETGGCIGATAIQQIQSIIFDQAFLGGCAMDPVTGLTGFDLADSEFKKIVIRQSNQVIVPLIMDKIPKVARYIVAQSDEIDMVVTQNKLDPELHQQFTRCGVNIYNTDNNL